jgi:hypothetical protein
MSKDSHTTDEPRQPYLFRLPSDVIVALERGSEVATAVQQEPVIHKNPDQVDLFETAVLGYEMK